MIAYSGNHSQIRYQRCLESFTEELQYDANISLPDLPPAPCGVVHLCSCWRLSFHLALRPKREKKHVRKASVKPAPVQGPGPNIDEEQIKENIPTFVDALWAFTAYDVTTTSANAVTYVSDPLSVVHRSGKPPYFRTAFRLTSVQM